MREYWKVQLISGVIILAIGVVLTVNQDHVTFVMNFTLGLGACLTLMALILLADQKKNK